MTRLQCRVFAKVLTILLWLGQSGQAFAQSATEPNRVASVVEDTAGNLILLNTSKRVPLAAPIIQYLPGPDVGTILVADFPGVLWNQPSRTITPSQKWIRSIHIGQFQANPPILRVAVSTDQPQLLRNLAFRSSPGVLVIKWMTASEHAKRMPTNSKAKVSEEESAAQRLHERRGYGADYTKIASSPRRGYIPVESQDLPELKRQRETQRTLPPVRTGWTTVPKTAPAPNIVTMAPPPISGPGAPTATGQDKTQSETTAALPPSVRLPGKQEKIPQPAPERRQPQEQAQTQANGSESKSETGTPPADPGSHHVSKWKAALKRLFGPAKSAEDAKEEHPDAKPAAATAEAGGAKSGPAGPNPVSPLARGTNNNMVRQTAADAALRRTPATQTARSQEAAVRKSPAGTEARTANDAQQSSANPLPHLAVSGTQPAKVELCAAQPFAYRSFRLHDPERYVVDIESAPEFASAPLPVLEKGPYLKALRIGHPENQANIARVVLDLSGQEVEVSETRDDLKNILSLTVGAGAPLPALTTFKPTGTVTVVVDAGHGGSDPGAQRGDIQEKEITLEIAEKVKRLLEHSGIKVTMTRSQDTAVSLEDRVTLTNTLHPDLFLSVHINSLETNTAIHGIETYYQTDQSRDLAKLVHEELVSKLEAPDRNIRKARFYVINHTPVPAILAEVGFISNKDERSKLISSDYQSKVAGALAEGVILYLVKRTDVASSNAARANAGTTGPSNQSGISSGHTVDSLAQVGASSARQPR